jgi:predicted NAD-dependent protein-ADP-ribosyltransferase YbiA (DUF1768 family)
MNKIQSAKFSQNADLRDTLLKTGKKTITQYHPRDKYWGNGGLSSQIPKFVVLIGLVFVACR